MNTYNDNLYNGVVSSLNAQEKQLIQKKAQLKSAMFSLYYAQGALFTAESIASETQVEYEENLTIERQAVNVNDISNSLLTTAKLANKYLANSVNNAAVAAANVQIASNAIVLLASDVGSIYSIVSAANASTDICEQSKLANDLMEDTAYLAEVASQHAMEASQETAEVSGAAVQTGAEITNNSVTSLYDIAAADLKSSEELLASNNDKYATASAAEKVAEGNLEDSNVGYFAAESAYDLSNKELNLHLEAEQTSDNPLEYEVKFDYYYSPFDDVEDDDLEVEYQEKYPVEAYFVMLVKNKNKSTFSMATAEYLLTFTEEEKRYKKVDPWHRHRGHPQASITLDRNDLYDSDGEMMRAGEEYVVFVLAELLDEYKKRLNNYSDYLTAASLPFSLTSTLAEATKIEVDEEIVELDLQIKHLDKDDKHKVEIDTVKENRQQLTFEVAERFNKVEYRCIFLPKYSDEIKGLLTNPEVRNYETELAITEAIREDYDRMGIEVREQINKLSKKIENLDKKVSKQRKMLRRMDEEADGYEKVVEAFEKNKANLHESNSKLRLARENLMEIELNKKKAMLIPIPVEASKCGFLFNLTIAEQVSYANYKIAEVDNSFDPANQEDSSQKGESSKSKSKKKSKAKDEEVLELGDPTIPFPITKYELVIGPEVTDNYGNRLIKDQEYIPVILSYSIAEDKKKITNALSDFDKTKTFVYKGSLNNIN